MNANASVPRRTAAAMATAVAVAGSVACAPHALAGADTGVENGMAASAACNTRALDELIARRMADAGVMGLSAAILVHRRVVWMKGYGYADPARSRAFTPDTVMNVGSIAKPVTGVAMMQAVHGGLLALDEDVNRYLPFRVVNPRYPEERITLRHLATHTSGITDRWEVYSRTYHYGGDSPEPLGRFLEDYFTPGRRNYSESNFIAARPGARREYSNIGAALAGYIVERAVGERIDAYTRRRIFLPMGMANTGWFLSKMDVRNHSTLFVSQNGFTIPIPLYGSTTYPDGGVRTSVADLAKFFGALLNGGELDGRRMLDESMAAEMQRFQFADGNRPENYPAADGNSGLFWRTKFGGKRVGHGGSDPGLQTEMLANREGTLGVIVLMNTSLGGEDARAFVAILDAVWACAESLAPGAGGASTGSAAEPGSLR